MFCRDEGETELDAGFAREGALHRCPDGNASNEAKVGPSVMLLATDRLS